MDDCILSRQLAFFQQNYLKQCVKWAENDIFSKLDIIFVKNL